MHLLDVNALVALAWDSHVHHATARAWFTRFSAQGWATAPVIESGFVRVSCNRMALPAAIPAQDAITVLLAFRGLPGHAFFTDDVSPVDPDFPAVSGHRQVTDAQLLTLARRNTCRLLTFDRGLKALGGDDVELLAF